jgi:hypothetical protein
MEPPSNHYLNVDDQNQPSNDFLAKRLFYLVKINSTVHIFLYIGA